MFGRVNQLRNKIWRPLAVFFVMCVIFDVLSNFLKKSHKLRKLHIDSNCLTKHFLNFKGYLYYLQATIVGRV